MHRESLPKDFIRIVIADDQPIIRQGLSFIIEAQPDMKVIGEAGDGENAIELIKELDPDLVLMDIQMPKYTGIEATRLIREVNPMVKVILLTTFDVQAYVADGIRAGAVGYLLKDSDTQTLLEGIRAAHRGAVIYQSMNSAQAMAEAIRQLPQIDVESANFINHSQTYEHLTDKELEVLQYMAYGHRNHEIADLLHISEGTVKTHVHRIFSKLGVSDRTQAVVIALRTKLVK
jgi:DNA-binding NarL/FixJ family response regulator